MTEGGPYRIGQRFGPYTLEAYLGSGAFKSVYRARAESEVVALGFPHQQDPEGLAEMEKEFSVIRRLVHPNILRALGLERYDGVSFLVTEYLEGVTLREKLREHGPFPMAEAVRYVALVCDALAYAHAARVMHRDVKPENIFVTTGNIPKLLDFGTARALARTSEKASTRIGTVEYMAPELLQGAAGTNADLWALGITLYELMTGARPFTGEVGDVISKILTGRYDEGPLQERQVDGRVVRVLRKMLRKNPEERYQTAEELARDLEMVARRARVLYDDESRLEVLIRASYPLIYVCTSEEERVLEAARSVTARLSEERGRPRRLYVWSASKGLRDANGQIAAADSTDDPTAALDHIIENPEDAVYVFLDIHAHFTPVTTRLIRDAARAVRTTRKSVLLVSPFFRVPEELQAEVNLAVFQLPDRERLEPLVERAAAECREQGLAVEISDEDAAAVARAAIGLTLAEAERSIRRAVVRMGGLRPGADRLVIEDKTQIIRKSGILEYYHTPESFARVGGLEALIAWFRARAAAFRGSARSAGLPQPKGVLLAGVPGCGKSLSARALAGEWGVPLLRLDVGRVFGSLVGASEANLRRAIQTAEAVSPCVLWIDEVEKGFAGVRGESGGGVARRVFGDFLTWLQDKKSPVFVVATANDLTGIPPEFLRGGRFDEKFFVGLPDKARREAIFRIHLARRRRDPAKFDLAALSESTAGFSGAEIEQSVIEGLYRAFDAERDLETADVQTAIGDVYPLSRARAAEIHALTEWARVNARAANGA